MGTQVEGTTFVTRIHAKRPPEASVALSLAVAAAALRSLSGSECTHHTHSSPYYKTTSNQTNANCRNEKTTRRLML